MKLMNAYLYQDHKAQLFSMTTKYDHETDMCRVTPRKTG